MTLPSTPTLGGHTLQSPFLLAPLEGVSDVGFRRLCFEQGAALTFTEMVRARGLAKRNKATYDLVDTFHDHVPTGIQLMTTGPQELQDALSVIEELAFSTHTHWQNLRAIDLNFGCPSKDIIQIGAGPAMLKRRARMAGIFDVLVAFKAQTRLKLLSVSAKIRLGLNQKEQDHKVFLPVVEAAEKLDWITVHARHAGQRSRDKPTWSAIAEAKKVAKVPVVGNGDVVTRADAERMYAETGCDAFLIARAAIASPWAFRELRGAGPAMPTVAEVDAEATRYQETSQRLAAVGGTKTKYREFHTQNFARLRALAQAASTSTATAVPRYSSATIPKNAHM